MQPRKLGMQASAVVPVREYANFLHPKSQASKAMVIPSLQLFLS